MKCFKKLISLFLVLTLVLSLCPAGFAAGETSEETNEFFEPEPPLAEDGFGFEPVEMEPMPSVEEDDLFCEEEFEQSENAGDSEDSEEVIQSSDENERNLFPGMPEGYALSASQLAIKKKLAENGIVSKLAASVPGVDYADGEVLLLADSTEYAQMAANAYGAELIKFEYGIASLRLINASVLEAVAAGADMSNNLPAVEANFIETLVPVPSDLFAGGACLAAESDIPVFGSWKTWYDSYSNDPESRDAYLSNPSDSTYQYMHDVVNSYAVWDITKGAGVTVAVLDTGVYPHEDLFNNIAGSVCVDPAWEAEALIHDHGTHVAGIIAAEEGNGLGGAGIAPEAKVYSVRIFENNKTSNESVLKGLYLAMQAKNNGMDGLKVINMSLGGYTYSYLLEQRIREVIDSGITVVAAMGNEGSNIMSYPAALNVPGLIAVCSSDRANGLSYFSNYGPWADVSAPGSDIMSTVFPKSGSYASMSGTSMATPVVAGICALYLSIHPNASPAQVEAAIKGATKNGIVDASLLFDSKVSAPAITPEQSNNNILPWNSSVTISSADSSDTIIYTLDGTTPSAKNGKAVGKVCSGGSAVIDINSAGGFIPGKILKIKAISVNAFGLVSSVSSFEAKVGYAVPERVEIISRTDRVSPGKSYFLKAEVYPLEAAQTVRWKISDRENGGYKTTLDSVNGILRVGKNETGVVYVQAYTPDNSVESEPLMINVGSEYQVRKIVIDEKNVTMYHNLRSDTETCQLHAHVFTSQYPDMPLAPDHVDWTTSKPGVALVDADGFVTPTGAGTAVITCTAADGTNVKAKCTVKVVSIADEISISGFAYVAPGKKTTYKANTEPKDATLKKVVWEIEDSSDSSITIGKNGTLSVPKSVEPGGFVTIKASVVPPYVGYDGELAEDRMTVEIQPTVRSLKITTADSGFRKSGLSYNFFHTLTFVQLYSTEIQSEASESNVHNSYIQLDSDRSGDFYVGVIWRSSNTNVATVDPYTGLVKAVSAGKAKITCTALDSGKKTAAVTVEVINPVSRMTVVPASSPNQKYLGIGQSILNKVVFDETYGKPSIKKVKWSLKVTAKLMEYDPETGELLSSKDDKEVANAIVSGKWIAVDSTVGILSTTNGLDRYIIPSENNKTYQIKAEVIATATDGTGASASRTYTMTPLSLGIQTSGYDLNTYDPDTDELISSEHIELGKFCKSVSITIHQGDCSEVKMPVYNTAYGESFDYSVCSGKPEVAGAYCSEGSIYIVPGISKGKTLIIVSTTDGSNNKLLITFNVI